MSNHYLSPLAIMGVGFVYHDGCARVSEAELIDAHPEVPVGLTLRRLRAVLAQCRCAEHGVFPTVHMYFTKRRSQLEIEIHACCAAHEDCSLEFCATRFPNSTLEPPAIRGSQLTVVAG
jgi:hypothetical protein